MASEPPEDAIANFVSFTSTTREQAISFLKANNLDSQKAINAYFEDPTGPRTKTTGLYNESSGSSFGYGQQDNAPKIPATAPPSRPPSRVNMHETSQGARTDDPVSVAVQSNTGTSGSGQGLSLAEREEQELQQAVAMSLNQGMGQQESGVTAINQQPHFGKATRDHYDEGAWAMTLFNATSQEVVISPNPEDRKRIDGEPAFIRPTQDSLYLGGFLTILHEIPLAREALLLRNKVLFDYGNDAQWWNGQPINLPKIVTIHDGASGDSDWDDIIHETQRLMVFLDKTQRAFGSSDALTNLKSMNALSSDSEEAIARFLETWHAAAIRADPENPLATVFMTQAYKTSPFDEGDEAISKDLFLFEPLVEGDHGQTLYDVLDNAIWSDRPGESLDDVWLEHVGDVVIMKLDAFDNGKSVDVKAPAVFYPDRYMSSCRELAIELRTKRLRVQEEVQELERLIQRYTKTQATKGSATMKDLLDKAAAAVTSVLSKNPATGADSMSSEMANQKSERIIKELQAVSARIEIKVKELESRKQSAMETLRSYSRALTEQSESPNEPPLRRYSLRGVCTEPHVTYVLKRNDNSDPKDVMEVDGENNSGYQWWRLSFSTEDGRTRQAAKREAQGDSAATQDGDVVGYTARKVREIEVLRAAREEWRSVLLVYASDTAMSGQLELAPTSLQAFVTKDNEAFAAECEQSTANAAAENPQDSSPKASQPRQSTTHQGQQVNVFDYQVSDFDNDTDSEQEMKERKGSKLVPGTAVNQAPMSRALDDDSEWHAGDDTEMIDHVEHA
ncbi:hypothetical protein N7462_003866 [Penicillium macrosclerotiorum]|uniref:uncharacterized protein n=1 Tax=Penicillium macrosclerotiorum TaxID=303699 RepID=UPI0025474A86|nr:uncharacterized protein N7462_003866 [Penicillium macrosclerotiorum]KAJ5689474.1 hypothetical protein N7462_003866 [Penicillium macrosclerotiorum]